MIVGKQQEMVLSTRKFILNQKSKHSLVPMTQVEMVHLVIMTQVSLLIQDQATLTIEER